MLSIAQTDDIDTERFQNFPRVGVLKLVGKFRRINGNRKKRRNDGIKAVF
jgi:hypothetical protein